MSNAHKDWLRDEAMEKLQAKLAAAEDRVRVLEEALGDLAVVAEAYSADQDSAPDPRCGLVHPISVEIGRELNAALDVADNLINPQQGRHT